MIFLIYMLLTCGILLFWTPFLYQQKLLRRKRRKIKASEENSWCKWFFPKFCHFAEVLILSLYYKEKERSAWADWSTINSCSWPFSIWRFPWRRNPAVQRWVSIWWRFFCKICNFTSKFLLQLWFQFEFQ